MIEACGGSKSCASPRDTRKKRIGNVCARFENRNQDRDVYRFTLHSSCTLHCSCCADRTIMMLITAPTRRFQLGILVVWCCQQGCQHDPHRLPEGAGRRPFATRKGPLGSPWAVALPRPPRLCQPGRLGRIVAPEDHTSSLTWSWETLRPGRRAVLTVL